ncbi:MAG: EAL domain-containing protein [Actinomycetota bacterium]
MTTIPDLDDGIHDLAEDLAVAAAAGEVQVHYLPTVGLADGAVHGVEALARWCPDDQVIEAEVFLELAERSGAIVAIGRHVLHTACTEVAAWNRQPGERDPLHLSVNLSPAQAVDPSIVDDLAEAIATSGLDPALLTIDLPEPCLRDLGEAGDRLLRAFAGLGVRVALDDFGTAATALPLLQDRVDELKVDRSFVARMDQDPGAAAIVRSVLALGRALGVSVVAEGVERPAQEQMLRTLRCEAAQGWLYARPSHDLAAVVEAAQQAATRSLDRRLPGHGELWAGIATPGAAARLVEAVFEVAPIGMVLVDGHGRHVAANPAAADLLGHPAADLTQRSCWEIIHPADLQADLEGTDRLLRGEATSYRLEQRAVGADGVERWVEVTVSGIPGDHRARGEAPRLLRQIRSIAEERRAGEDAALLGSVIEASPDALAITDVHGRCTHWDRAAGRLLGWTADEMAGQPVSRLVTPNGQMALARAISAAVQGSVGRWPEASLVGADGERREVDVILGPVLDGEGQVDGIVALGRDIAELRAGNRALREAHEALAAHAADLSAANERLGAFAATLTHDLLQPVAAVDGFLGLLRNHAEELTDDHRDWLEHAIRGKERIAEAITALHRAATEAELDLVPLALGTAVEEVARDLGLGEGSVDTSAVGRLLVRADHGLLARILANLLQNAGRYRHPDRPLQVTVTARDDGDDGFRTIVVTDNGQGIAADELDEVFERGVRGRAASGTLGTGTGLATVRTLVERLGGSAWAEPHEGGARICLRLRCSGSDG